LFTNFSIAQCDFADDSDAPKELFRKRLKDKEVGFRYGNPYTMFNRQNYENWDLETTLNKVKNNIISDINGGYANLYKDIWNYANNAEPNKCAYDVHCAHPQWVKSNAIVYLLGLKYDNQTYSKDTFLTMTSNTKDSFFNKAHQGLRNLNPRIIGCSGFGDCGKVREKAIDLVYYLQAYDLLKAGGGLPSSDQDKNGNKCTARNKLREFARNLYKQSDDIINSWTGWKKNHGIICASALGMAAIVLNDAGTETNFFVGVWGSIKSWFGTEEVEYAPNYSPLNWFDRAQGTSGGNDGILGGEDGLEDNFFVGDHGAGCRDVPQSSADGTSGYAEGPGYFIDLAGVFLPYLRALDNTFPNWNGNNLLAKDKYKNILNWYTSIQNHDGSTPSYDNSNGNGKNFIGVLGGDYKSLAQNVTDELKGDILFSMGLSDMKINKPEPYYYNENSGNIVLRNETSNSKHSFHMLAEKGIAKDVMATDDWDDTHEDDDLGSFMFYVQDKDNITGVGTGTNWPLAIDPPYLGWNKTTKSSETNRYWLHNTIEIDDGQDAITRDYHGPKYEALSDMKINSNNTIRSFNLYYGYSSTKYTANFYYDIIKRNVNEINTDNILYYFFNDYIDATPIALSVSQVQLNINGNGDKNQREDNNSSKPYTFRQEGNLYRWTYPCGLGNNWDLTFHYSALNRHTNGKSTWDWQHSSSSYGSGGSLNGGGGTIICYKNSDSIGQHTRLQIHQPVRKTIFQSFLFPHKCNTALPTLSEEETADHVTTTIKFVNSKDTSITRSLHKNVSNPSTTAQDTVSHFHYARWASSNLDSVRNPFNLPYQDSVWLRTNAEKAFVKHNTIGINLEGYKYCPPTHANLRHASFSNGTLLQIDTLKLMEASAVVSASLSFAGRYYYTGYVDPLSHSGSIKFHLPDVGRGVDMMAMHGGDTMTSTYDSLTNTLSMDLPNDKTTFIIQQKQQCADCYFPPASINVVDTFNADDGQTHTLGHKLKVLPNNGNLIVSNGTRIFMCEGVYLRNKNNIVIESECQTKDGSYKICDDIKIDTSLAHSKNSAIVISAGSALVLDANSHTYIKNGGAIYVKRNGTLFIKNDAFVQIGDSGTCSSNRGWGEIVAEDGAFINIQDNAHIEFRRTIGDTVDRNLFYIPRFNPMGIALAGNYPFIHYVMYQDTIVPDSNFSYARAICDIATHNPIKNKEWGFSNIMTPRPFMRMRSDTLCPGEPLYIDLKRFLNDNAYQFKVCRMDSVYMKDIHNVYNWVDTCIVDTMSHDSILPDPVCMPPHAAPDYLLYYFKTNSLHRITMEVSNDCGVRVDTTAYVFVMDTPKVSISMPSTICEGVGTGTVSITKLNRFPIKSYTFEITEIPDTALMKVRKGITQVYSRTYYDTLPNTYNFDDYYFKSGRRYSVSLTLTSNCGGKTFYTETSVPLAVKIVAGKPTIFGNRIGNATSVQLNGYVHAADSFTWSPSYGLNRTDTLTILSSTTQDTTYILTAYKGACVAQDSIKIRYNSLSYIGNNDTLCGGSQVFLGNRYNAALFLGWLNYQDIGIKTLLKNLIKDNLIDNGISDDNYLKFFNSFMFTTGFTDYEESGCYSYYSFFTQTESAIWDSIIKLPEFASYYNNFVNNMDEDLRVLDQFTSLIKDNVNTTYMNYFDEHLMDESSASCIADKVLPNYVNYAYTIYKDLSTNSFYVPLDISWYKIAGDTIEMKDWKDLYATIDSPIYTTTYLQQVYHSSGLVNIDSRTIFVDTSISPLFYPAMQWDSSAYFTNATSPSSSTNKYLWDFGDGSATSTDNHPFHTFPAFNTHYVVCLTANNHCGSYTYCDTVWIDSLHLGGSFRVTKGLSSGVETNKSETALRLRSEAVSGNASKSTFNIQNLSFALSNYPNPFDQSTIVDYEIWQTYSKAELRITNVLGQEVYSQKLNRPMDKVQIDGSTLHDGLYYYSLIVDGAVKLTKTMSVIR
ncbi:MAG: hypothetical protein EBZ58_06410, partial [Bacteroidetes bacterium]|nr:hypothetical protein [Bacteroidota bacterium]